MQCLRETYLPLYGEDFVAALLSEDSIADIAQEDREFLSSPDRRVVLAAEQGTDDDGPAGAADAVETAPAAQRLVGFASVCRGPQSWELQLVPDIAPERELVKLYTLPCTHGSGLGARLLEAAVGRESPVYLWIMGGNARAEAFYRKHGFREIGPRFAAEGPWAGQDTFRMRRD